MLVNLLLQDGRANYMEGVMRKFYTFRHAPYRDVVLVDCRECKTNVSSHRAILGHCPQLRRLGCTTTLDSFICPSLAIFGSDYIITEIHAAFIYRHLAVSRAYP